MAVNGRGVIAQNQNRPGDIHGIPVRNAALRLLLALSEALPKVSVLDQSDPRCRDLVISCSYLLVALDEPCRTRSVESFTYVSQCLSCAVETLGGRFQLQKKMKLHPFPLFVRSALVDLLRRFTWLLGVCCGLHDASDFGQASVEAWPRRGTELEKNGQSKTAFQNNSSQLVTTSACHRSKLFLSICTSYPGDT